MKVYAIHYPYEGPLALFATREAAQAALDNDPMYDDEYSFIEEWEVQA